MTFRRLEHAVSLSTVYSHGVCVCEMSQTTTITTTTPEGGTTVTTVTLKANGFYDEIEIEDMDFNEDSQTYTYPCPWYVKLFLVRWSAPRCSGD